MKAFGDSPITAIDVIEISRFLRTLDATGVSPRTVNKRRQLLSAVFTYAMREDTYVKLHGLRHGAGSLVARHTDAVFVQHFLGHANIATTERYMHAKVRSEDVERLNRAFGVTTESPSA